VRKKPSIEITYGNCKPKASMLKFLRSGKSICEHSTSVLPQLEMEKAFVR